MNKFIIYIVTNDVNDKVYIGQTTNTLENRFAGHCSCKGSSLYQPIKEIGREHFKISVLDDSATNLDELLKLEQHYVEKYDSIENGYNNAPPRKTKGQIHHSRIVSTTVDPYLGERIRAYSEKTSIPISRLLDKAIALFLETVDK